MIAPNRSTGLRLNIMPELDGSGCWHGELVLDGVALYVGMAPSRDRLVRLFRGKFAARQRAARGIYPQIGGGGAVMTCPTCLCPLPPAPPAAPPESCPTCGGTAPPLANWDAVRGEGGDDALAYAEEYYDLEDLRPGCWSEAALRSLGVRWALRTAGLGGPDADHAWQWDQIGERWAEVYDEGAHAVISTVRERRTDPRI